MVILEPASFWPVDGSSGKMWGHLKSLLLEHNEIEESTLGLASSTVMLAVEDLYHSCHTVAT